LGRAGKGPKNKHRLIRFGAAIILKLSDGTARGNIQLQLYSEQR